jgi:hypothetical protein
MSKHTIVISEVKDKTIEHTFISSRGQNSEKDIVACVPLADPRKTFFRVVSHGETVIETSVLGAAIKAYNKEP